MAPAPSLTPGALPAVWVASSPPIAFSFASVSSGVSGRIASSVSTIVSPLRLLTVTGTISSARRALVGRLDGELVRADGPAVDVGAGHLDLVADLAGLVDHLLPVKGLVSPSLIIASIVFTSPIRKPKRAPGSR